MWVRGLKQEPFGDDIADDLSHPMWVRGLKPATSQSPFVSHQSHPMWVRGLKLLLKSLGVLSSLVAPHVGAWIETSLYC